MRILVSIDDTDNLDSRGTGELASLIAADLETRGWGRSSYVTRHQLLVHPDIPYTSHNSAMCFSAEIDSSFMKMVIAYAADFLARESAAGSDPGLCVAAIDNLAAYDELLSFGQQAKKSVLEKEYAYLVARRSGIHLSEHGGTGQGIIGALAGAGLRLSGNDGRLKGKVRIGSPGDVVGVGDLCRKSEIDAVRTLDGFYLAANEMVLLGDKVKAVLLENRAILLVTASEPGVNCPPWKTCSRQQLRNY